MIICSSSHPSNEIFQKSSGSKIANDHQSEYKKYSVHLKFKRKKIKRKVLLKIPVDKED